MLGFPCGTLEGKVPVRVYLKAREFDAESIRVLGIAFECAPQHVALPDGDSG